ncbi:uncharacterized protein LOC128558963 [Mercenaria mercenaria]|uniref:uncharacterized protein LOC128558963 n=1 Tax=Mercenaria mercenaria TaxID=6596 RepID=UPI00234F2D46|nr:uncharacterized protein LOC128558963 [Mercenaria mercenaria]
MSWTNFLDPFNISRANISIKWYGFIDPDSSVDTYYITVSRNFSGYELTKGIVTLNANKSDSRQSAVVTLNDSLNDSCPIILTIWAQNTAGLNSTAFRVTIVPLSSSSERASFEYHSGSLELEKHSCKVHSCNQDCTCSVVGKYCTPLEQIDCVSINTSVVGTFDYPRVIVYSGLANISENATASLACLTGHWKTVGSNAALIVRYEWSMGLSGQKAGDGIFSTSEKQWYDVGKRTHVIHCLPLKSGLTHNTQYTIYVKAWYSNTEHFTFMSPPIMVDHTPPQQAKGRSILDSDPKCVIDYDIIDWMDELTFCWKGVFRETQSKLSYFTVALGTSVNGSDVFQIAEVGLETNVTLTNISLTHGTRYFFTVTAYNTIGMHNTLSSDGFVIDMDTPIAGVIFNTDKYIDKGYQSLTSTFSMSWHGFLDHHSGVKSYHIAVAEDGSFNLSNIVLRNVGLKTSYTFTNLKLMHGKAYVGLVKACDAAGHSSVVARTNLKHVDVTPPYGLHCSRYSLMQRNETKLDLEQTENESSNVYLELRADLEKDNLYKISGVTYGTGSIAKLILVMDRFEVLLHTSHNHDGSEDFEYNFISKEKKSLVIEIKQATITEGWHTLEANLYGCVHSSSNVNGDGAIKLQQIRPSVLGVTTLLVDPESSVYKIRYGIGTTRGGLQLRPFLPLNDRSQAVIDISVEHGSPLYLTVLAENHAGLTSNFTSGPIVIDKTPPVISNMNASSLTFVDGSNGSVYRIFANWKVEDDESGVKACYCGIGIGFQMQGIEKLKLAETNETCSFDNMILMHEKYFFIKAVCINNVELSQGLVSNSIVVSRYHTSVEFADLRVVSAIQIKQEIVLFGKNITDLYIQSDKSNVKIEWSGFEDISDIDHYEYRVRHESDQNADWKSINKHTLVEVSALHLVPTELYRIHVRAVYSRGFISEPLTVNLLVYGEHPQLTGKAMTINLYNRTIEVDWTGVFDIPGFTDLVYDVTVGSRRGYSDVIQYQRVKFQHCTFSISESTTVSSKINEIFIFVVGINSAGRQTQYEISFKM